MADHHLKAEQGIFVTQFAEAKLTIHRKLPNDHEFYSLVGRVASEWSHLEHLLDVTIWELSDAQPRLMACITAQIMGVGPKCKAIVSLGEARGIADIHLKPFRVLMNEAFPVADRRARAIHDPWYLADGSETPGQFRSMPYSDRRYGHKDIDKAEIDGLLANIDNLRQTAGRLRNTILDELSKLP